MCGIAGAVTTNNRIDAEQCVARMTQLMRHRGPDHQGCVALPFRNTASVAFGHTRLAIVDLSPAGAQPMVAGDSKHWITFNGEVYNFESLRSELAAAGVRFQSKTDTEVILEMFARTGTKSLSRLRGMFGFAIWDSERGILTLVRDPFGIKPVYYTQADGTFLFASEIRALLGSGMVAKRLSSPGVQSFLETGSVASPHTIIEGVRSLPPGCFLQVRVGKWIEASAPVTYFDLTKSDGSLPQPASRDEALVQLREILLESVRLHHISDVPLGMFLSGGIDSSAIVALAKLATSEPPKTFSVVFSEKQFSERDHARCVAKQFGSDHREVFLSESGLLEQLPEAVAALDQPSGDGFNTYVISKAVKQAGITVALSGLGGDELFAGYASFQRSRWMRMLGVAPASLRRPAAYAGGRFLNGSVQRTKFWDMFGSDATPDAVYAITRRLFSSREIGRLSQHPAIASTASSVACCDDVVNRVSELELGGYMANTLLRDTDSMSMAHALEVRVPFVDVEVARFVLALPGEWKVAGNRPKPLLVDALGGMLPRSVWDRPKMGFSLPFERWMHSSLKPEVDSVFAGARLNQLALDQVQARELWARFLNYPDSEKWSRPWALYVLAQWCERNGVAA